MISTAPPIESLQRIVLTGFMGSGKTTVGRLLAHSLQWRFADLDESVERREGLAVPEIFAQRGEASFREAETRALAELLQGTGVVIALGGGAVATPANYDLLQTAEQTAVLHLDAPFSLLYERCAAQALDPLATVRPLLGYRAEAEERFRRRSGLYASLAHLQINAAEEPEAVAASILTTLGRRFN